VRVWEERVTTSELGRLIAIDIIVVAGLSVLVGALAPRWPARWLARDPIPLRLLPWESPASYARFGVRTITRRLPELGAAFGGSSKSRLPGTSVESLTGYLVEVRRGEWVHWVSIASALVLLAFNPWWLAALFLLAAAGANAPFILILRNNRMRILRIIDKGGSRP
jgi:hypothetical protein